ncbi:endonuclease/exonuclease/phosphatase family protein [Luteibaculum oceani]|uniref:Endonuclease/exonuclease/phosphatase domain-containing protein n=1 Tax=Luteibaculum oceani TaxID=1294296 RepID=A0A5C6V504_9FLAO|nr:endonuclease/exonuclease/phosphatase family protein [Luteibaculum oceani]TXC78655.1 hypothetical protein FRX97_08025 [Luteibaculum oceani]
MVWHLLQLIFLFTACNSQSNTSQPNIDAKGETIAIAFYNVENLFDTVDDPGVNDQEFTPNGRLAWSEEKYESKISALAKTISEIGDRNPEDAPALIGLAEVENLRVLQDLVNSKPLKPYNYQIVHGNSSDPRGIDVALLYHSHYVEAKEIDFISIPSGQWKTREILKTTVRLSNGEELTIWVNHWPSRRGGVNETEYKRLLVANTLKQNLNSGTHIIMGDFNDTPLNKSIKELFSTESKPEDLDAGEFFNPFEEISKQGKGTIVYKGDWYLFDQILLSEEIFSSNHFNYQFADIYSSKHLLQQKNNKYKGSPFRTYAGPNYIGGPSDHLPVYVLLNLN